MALDELHRGAWCSTECALAYTACMICGRYHTPRDAFDEEHCSKECATRYVLQRSYGPEPVRFLFEE